MLTLPDLEARLAAFSISVDLEKAPPAHAERGGLLQALASLLLDAADNSPVRGRIVVAVRHGEVEDNPAALRLVRGLRRDGAVLDVQVKPLTGAEIAALLEERGLHELKGLSGVRPVFALVRVSSAAR